MIGAINKLLMILSNSPGMMSSMLSRRDTGISAAAASLARGAGLLAMLALSSPALASDRWEEAGGGAVAILPVPAKAQGITGGSLVCAEQKWNFRLRADLSGSPTIGSEAVVSIDDVKLTAAVEQAGSVVTIPVPYEAIEDLKAATRVTFSFGKDKGSPQATFSLRGSKLVLEAIAPRCSQIDMTGYARVGLVEVGPAVEQARPLMAEEAELFRAATKKEPTLAAATLELPEQRSMLFATLCGSTWYYGRSGCTFSAYVRTSATAVWQEAYNSEGVAMYIDPNAGNDGWPNLVTLPLVGGTEPTHWTWNGTTYELPGSAVAEGDPQVEGQGDVAQ